MKDFLFLCNLQKFILILCGDERGNRKQMLWVQNENVFMDFPGGAVVKNPPANAGDTGSSPGTGRSHVPRNN